MSRNLTSKQNAQQQLHPLEPEKQLPSLPLGFDLVKDRLAYQSERVNALDTKASFVLGSSTLIIGAATLTRSQIPPCHFFFFITIFIANIPQLWLITPSILNSIPILLMLSYIAGVIFAYQAYRIRGLYNVPNPRTIYERYLTRTEYETKRDSFRAMLEAYERNNKGIDVKIRWTNAALISLVILAVLLALPLLFQVIC